jgi:5-bromo-4-chloroindolyl phosphate hydrolysis protein
MEINDAKLYFEKWNKILFSTQSINQARAENAVKDAYHFCGIEVPKIYFFQSPLASKSLLENISFSADDYLQFKNNLEFELLLCSREHPTFYLIERDKTFVLVY